MTTETQPERRIPVGVWLRVDFPDLPDFVGYTYVDAQAGLSMRGGELLDGELSDPLSVVVRLTNDVEWEQLSDAEIEQYELERRPTWVDEFYGVQPEPGSLWGGWRDHSKLAGRFHPDHPDDIQVLVHDGGPRLTDRQPELVWVRTVGGVGNLFYGNVLNKPHKLQSVQSGSLISFVMPDGYDTPIMVTAKYMRELADWVVHGCQQCGLSELFDAPSDLMRVVFPGSAQQGAMKMFTSFCPMCGGVQVVQSRDCELDPSLVNPSRRRRWWQFWKWGRR